VASCCSQILLPRGFEDSGAAGRGHHGQQKLSVRWPSRGAAALAGFFGWIQAGETCRWEIRSSKAFCSCRDAGRGDFKEVPTGPARLGVLCRLAAGGRLRPAQSRSHGFRRDPVNPVRPDRGSLAPLRAHTRLHASAAPLLSWCSPGTGRPVPPAGAGAWVGSPGSVLGAAAASHRSASSQR